MECPHCRVSVHDSFVSWIDNMSSGRRRGSHIYWTFLTMECPACGGAIFHLSGHAEQMGANFRVFSELVYPRASSRPLAPEEVSADLAEDYNEACAVLSLSPKASAALSRRCLQQLLREQGFNQHNLIDAINAVLATKHLPSAISQNLDAIRVIGNFAAHPMKDKSTGEILPVEAEEADWNLDVLESLFDYYYVEPARAQKQKDALNEKLKAAGKPLIP